MGKNSASIVLETVFKDISCIENIIKDSKKIKQSYDRVNFSNDKEVEKIIEDTKIIVDSLKVETTKLDNYFHDNYKTWKKERISAINCKDSCSNINVTNENSLEKGLSIENVDKNKDVLAEENQQESVNVSKSEADKQVKMKRNDKVKDVDKIKSIELLAATDQEVSNEETKEAEHDKSQTKRSNQNREVEKDIDQVSAITQNVVDTSIATDTVNKINTNTSTVIVEDKVDTHNEVEVKTESNVDQKIFLKCVDIKKLVKPDILPHLKTPAPRSKDSINDSVLIISDSEEDVVNVTKKQVNKLKSGRPTKEEIKNKVHKLFRNSLDRSSSSNSSKRQTRNGKSLKDDTVITVLSDTENISLEKKENENKQIKTKPSTDSDSESNFTDKNKMRRKRGRPKKKFGSKTLSDTSSLSESEVISKSHTTKQKSKNIRKTVKFVLDPQTDKKFSCEAYIALPRIPCEKLKEHYLKLKEIEEVQRLTNLNSLKRSRINRPTEKKDQSSSSDAENIKPKPKRKKTGYADNNSSDENLSADENDVSNPKEPEPDASARNLEQEPERTEIDQEVVKMILDGIKSASDASAHASEIDEEQKEKTIQKGDDNKSKKTTKDQKSEKKDENPKESANDETKKKQNSGWRNDKLLTAKISDSDSEDEFIKFKKRSNVKNIAKLRVGRKKLKNVIDSDSDSENGSKKKDSSGDEFQPQQKSSSSESNSDKEKSEEENEEEKDTEKKKRRRIKRVKESSSDEENKSTRKTIRKVIGHESLAEATKRAEKEEKERKARIAERQKKYNRIFDRNELEDATVDTVVLDFNEETKEEILAVHKDIAKKLKPHQVKGVQYMWDACFESVERAKKTNGSGCILAHCMGLGKTLQVITLIHTLLTNKELTGVQRVLVVCPVNTVLNWVSEFSKWLDDIEGPEIEVYDLVSSKQNNERKFQVQEWTKDGGVLVLGYDMFRNLTNPVNKRLKKSEREVFQKGLVNPGPDLVICDEGHLLKNEKTNLSISMNRIHTVRRIVLTGTPMQNNMKEYYCMVQFVKPNLLGTYKEYLNRFVNPITNGQYTDSTQHDINIMRKRSHVLHKMLDGVVQRKDYAVLTPYLPPKYEYVLFLTLTEVQINLYRHYLEEQSRRPVDTKIRTTFLFVDFQEFQRICTHPRLLLVKSQENAKKCLLEDYDSEGSLKDFIDDNDSEEEASSTSGSNSNSESDQSIKSDENKKKHGRAPIQRVTRNAAATLGIDVEEEAKEEVESNEWWSQYCSGKELDNIALSSKLYLLFEILQQCELIGDKLLVFSQSLYSLSIIEYFLAKIDEATQKGDCESVSGFSGSWAIGLDYFRLDGSSSCDNRSAWCKSFNSPDNPRARLFLISTKAGGLGINLIGANRVVIFDVSWNPSHDIQSIYRVYRFGQTKPCYIYRFVTNGTMEMKIYERQVTKQAISKRVIDEQQIDRHYNQNDLAELYNFEPKPDNQPTPLIPKDVLLAELLQKEKDRIFTYHEHQSLLENKEDEELNEAERKAAWEEFESEKTARVAANTTGGWIKNLPVSSITAALINIVQKDNPTWTREQVQGVVPLIVQQLREQVDKGEMLLFNRIVTELKLMQASQQQRLQEYYMQQQLRVLQQRYAQQQQHNSAGPSMGFDFGNALRAALNDQSAPTISNEIVELND